MPCLSEFAPLADPDFLALHATFHSGKGSHRPNLTKFSRIGQKTMKHIILIGIALAAFCGQIKAQFPGTWDTPSAYNAEWVSRFRQAMAITKDGGADTKILFIGDSTSEGIGSALNNTFVGYGAYPTRVKLSGSSSPPVVNGLGVYNTQDGRWILGTGWGVSGSSFGFCLGGNNAGVLSESGASGNLTFTPGATQGTYDSFTVYYLANPGNGSVTATATGGLPATINTNSAAGYGSTTVTAASAGTGNSLVITPVSGTVFIAAVEPFLSTTPSIRKANVGVSGATSGQCSNSSASAWASIQAIEYYAPNLTIISLGVNDAAGSVSVSTYIANIQTIITAAKQSGDVILETMIPSQNSGWESYEMQYVPALYKLAQANSVPIFDIYRRFGNAFNSAFTSTDGTHPNEYGYWDWASGLDSFINQFAWK